VTCVLQATFLVKANVSALPVERGLSLPVIEQSVSPAETIPIHPEMVLADFVQLVQYPLVVSLVYHVDVDYSPTKKEVTVCSAVPEITPPTSDIVNRARKGCLRRDLDNASVILVVQDICPMIMQQLVCPVLPDLVQVLYQEVFARCVQKELSVMMVLSVFSVLVVRRSSIRLPASFVQMVPSPQREVSATPVRLDSTLSSRDNVSVRNVDPDNNQVKIEPPANRVLPVRLVPRKGHVGLVRMEQFP